MRKWGPHLGDDAVDVGLGVSVAVLACRELAEVAGSDGADGVEEAEDDAAGGHAVDLDVELQPRGQRARGDRAQRRRTNTSGPDAERALARGMSWEGIKRKDRRRAGGGCRERHRWNWDYLGHRAAGRRPCPHHPPAPPVDLISRTRPLPAASCRPPGIPSLFGCTAGIMIEGAASEPSLACLVLPSSILPPSASQWPQACASQTSEPSLAHRRPRSHGKVQLGIRLRRIPEARPEARPARILPGHLGALPGAPTHYSCPPLAAAPRETHCAHPLHSSDDAQCPARTLLCFQVRTTRLRAAPPAASWLEGTAVFATGRIMPRT